MTLNKVEMKTYSSIYILHHNFSNQKLSFFSFQNVNIF